MVTGSANLRSVEGVCKRESLDWYLVKYLAEFFQEQIDFQ